MENSSAGYSCVIAHSRQAKSIDLLDSPWGESEKPFTANYFVYVGKTKKRLDKYRGLCENHKDRMQAGVVTEVR
jgi:hypothetical protein